MLNPLSRHSARRLGLIHMAKALDPIRTWNTRDGTIIPLSNDDPWFGPKRAAGWKTYTLALVLVFVGWGWIFAG